VATYVGSAELLDGDDQHVLSAQVSLASIDVTDGSWQGYAHGIDAADLDGHDVTVSLPNGTTGRARVIVDLTGDTPIIRLKGIGPGPI
jgi:hypothetical protein